MQIDRLINDGPRIQEWMHSRSGLPIQRDFHGIARERDGRLLAAFGYDSFQAHCCQQHLCIDEPSALNRELLVKAYRVPFIQWNYSALLAIIPETNAKSLNIALRLGYVECGKAPGHLWFGIMRRDDCRWLKLPER